MKKINSIHVGTKVLGMVLLFLIGIPFMSIFIKHFISKTIGEWFFSGSILIGLIILCISCFILGIELRQDRKVYDKDTKCALCGTVFEQYKDHPPYL